MSVPVPLTVVVGGKHVTRQLQSLSFRKEAIGGVQSISFGLARPLSDMDGLEPLSSVLIYDSRSAETVAGGRLSDTGRGAGSDGERWDCVAFGPAQHASEIKRPLVYVDRSLEGWRYHLNANVGPGATWQAGSTPDNGTPGLLSTWAAGTVVPAGTALTATRYTRIMEAAQKIARLSYAWRSGISGLWAIDSVYSTDGNWGASDTGTPDTFNTGGGTRTHAVGSGITNGRNVADIRTYLGGAGGTVTGDATWSIVVPIIEAMRVDAAGADIATGYTGYVYAHQVITDLLGRCLPEFDGAGASVATTPTAIEQLAYPTGTTAAEVLDDMMALEPAYRWTTTPDKTGNGYGFRWELWPTTVRYEASLDDGGSFPLSTQDVYNSVIVVWTDELGRTHTTRRTMACQVLDDLGLIRQEMFDLGSELGTQSQAEQAGDAFLEAHNVPKNAGTLTVARPIRDVINNRMVDPWEIEPGELIRIVGVEAYPDAFNTDSNDGRGVFRIFALDYSGDSNSSSLSLDSDPRTTADALVMLMTQRQRG